MHPEFDPAGRVVFRASDHRYEIDSVPVLSVTQAIGVALKGLLGERHWREEARARGQAVHSAIALASEGDLDEGSIDERVRPRYDAYQRFAADVKPVWLHNETVIYDDLYRYAGAFDALGQFTSLHAASILGSRRILDLVDWKSGDVPFTVGWQTAAYARPIKKLFPNDVIRRWCLQLRSDGAYKLVCVSRWPDAAHHESDFLSLLRTAQLRAQYASRTEDELDG